MNRRKYSRQKITMYWLLLLLPLLLIACTAAPTEATPQTEPVATTGSEEQTENSSTTLADFSDDLTQFIEDVMAEDGIPGTAVAVVQGNEIIFNQGFGYRDVENQLPVTTETLFHIGSTNKSMTALLIATLVDAGVVDWDTPVVEIDPDFELSSQEATAEVTLRHLLSMQSGIPNEAEDDFAVDYATAEDTFDFVAETALLGMPGDEFSYSNLSSSLAGYVGVIAAGDDYDSLYDGYAQLLQQHVLKPIGMETAVVRVSEAQNNPNYGKSYILDSAGNAIAAEREDFDEDPLAPSGTLKANVTEMAYYISTHLNRGQAPNGTQVVSAENLTETWKPALENYGMGWETSEYQEMRIVSHEGAFDNYLSVIGFLPEYDIGFVILTNSEEASGQLIEESPIFIVDSLGLEQNE